MNLMIMLLRHAGLYMFSLLSAYLLPGGVISPIHYVHDFITNRQAVTNYK